MRVLYLSHTAQMSGGEHSLIALLGALPPEVEPVLAAPRGPLADAAVARGVEVVRVPGTAGSLKLHPWRTARTVGDLGRAAWKVRRLAREANADLVHANSVRAGLSAVTAARLGGPPAVVHVRDCPPVGLVADRTLKLVGSGATLVLANSEYTRARFTRASSGGASRVVYSPVDLAKFDPAGADRARERMRLGIEGSTFTMAVVAQLTPWKAQDDAVRMAARLKEAGRDVRLLLIGSAKFVSKATRFDNRLFVRELQGLIDSLGVQDEVVLMGERRDVPEILAAADVLLLPSWEEPFGRAVVEGMAMELPVVATSVGGPAEIITDGEGLLLPPRSPDVWADALEDLAAAPERRREMGKRGRRRAKAEFGLDAHVRDVISAYEQALAAA